MTMAGDWIKMRVDLQTHPKVVRILSATMSDKFRVVGGLLAVWSIFDAHSADGILNGYTPNVLDHIIGWEGFCQAMIDVGWMVYDGHETLILPEFEEHNGKGAKRRAEDQKRKRNDRQDRPESVRKNSGQNADDLRTREEKNLEEQKLVPPSGGTGHNSSKLNEHVHNPPNGPDLLGDPPIDPATTERERRRNVPFQQIIDLYHAKLPELPRCEKLTEKRKGQIRQRWQDDLKKLDNWGIFFDFVRQSKFLMGLVPGSNGRPPFRADIEWLTNATNFTAIAEDKYHR